MTWTAERIEQMKSLWTDGLSAAQIAKVLGGVTRNAVIGKVHRIGLAGRGPRIRVVNLPPEPSPPLTLENGERVSLETLEAGMCAWPIGDPCDSSFHYCGNERADRTTRYCKAHKARSVQPGAKRAA